MDDLAPGDGEEPGSVPEEAQLEFEGFETEVSADDAEESSDEGAEVEASDDDSDDAEVRAAATPAEDRIARLERTIAEQHETLYKITQGRAPAEPKGPPVDPNEIETWDQLRQYMSWEQEQKSNDLRTSLVADAQAAASEQRARGLYSKRDMGEGRDYDTLIQRHIEPVEQAAPGIRQFFSTQKDPATARYAMAAMLELLDRVGGDPVKGFATIWKQIDRKGSATADVLGKIGKAAEAQVGLSSLKGSRSGGGGRRALTADDVSRMSLAEFSEKFPHLT